VRRKVIDFLKDEDNLDETFDKWKNLSKEVKLKHILKLASPDT
jgi:hypothetical protein